MMDQINHFVSSYQKDYSCPYTLSMCRTESSTKPIAVKVCAYTDSPQVLKKFLDASLEKDLDRTRQLSEPKICSKTRPVLQAEIIQIDKPPKICVTKVNIQNQNLTFSEFRREEKPPHLLNTIFPDSRTNGERFKTTYQAHYSDPAERMIQRDLTQRDDLALIHTDGQQLRCHMPIKITIETDCPPHCPSSSRINAAVKHDCKQKNGSMRGKRCEIADVGPQTSISPWKSEYQDSISKIGHAIMRVKLHQAKKKTLPLQYQQCISN
ncbi:uncharacterized protein [Anoplolepis gracilipes]|uniref:uncharacterized protein isoform X2 n=1 Tax=Anoplolepis gracilipes TaxID=354296 RepID=UPI003BA170C9